jgi:hypothetical protein
MMTGNGDWSGSGWLMWGLGGLVLVGLVILGVLLVSCSQQRDI